MIIYNFPFTDAVYTERYMGMPNENTDSYQVNNTQVELYLLHIINKKM